MPYAILALFIVCYVLASVLWPLPTLVAAAYGVMSVTSFAFYAIDKRAARNRAWRTPEKNLLLMGLLCGWPGALLAQQLLRHKTSKRSFQHAFWLTVVANLAGLGWMCWQCARASAY